MGKNKFLFLLIVFLSGCYQADIIGELPFETISKGDFSYMEHGTFVITSATQWARISNKTVFEGSPFSIDPFSIDYSKDMIIISSRGDAPSTGYDVEITKVVADGGRLIVYKDEHEPGYCWVCYCITNPYHIVKTKKVLYPIKSITTAVICHENTSGN